LEASGQRTRLNRGSAPGGGATSSRRASGYRSTGALRGGSRRFGNVFYYYYYELFVCVFCLLREAGKGIWHPVFLLFLFILFIFYM
jgi:hypothetical protein